MPLPTWEPGGQASGPSSVMTVRAHVGNARG